MIRKNIQIFKADDSHQKRLKEIFYKERIKTFYWVERASISYDDFEKSTQDELIFVAKFNDEIAGFVSVYEKDKFIHNLFIDSDFKRKGVGKALLNFVGEMFSYPLSLKCVIKNQEALNFYISLGWEIKEEILIDEPHYLMTFNVYK